MIVVVPVLPSRPARALPPSTRSRVDLTPRHSIGWAEPSLCSPLRERYTPVLGHSDCVWSVSYRCGGARYYMSNPGDACCSGTLALVVCCRRAARRFFTCNEGGELSVATGSLCCGWESGRIVHSRPDVSWRHQEHALCPVSREYVT
jgi:hypothetical protein